MSRSLYLIDGHAQIYRAYYAPFQNLASPAGEPTRATHVFWQVVLNLVRDRKPDYLALVLDVSDETVFRREFYPEYKAHRDPPPDDLPPQFDRIVAMAEALELPILRVPTFEADDVMATLARRLATPDLHVYLVSRDKDLEQLLSEHVSMFDPGKNEVITPQSLYAARGWWPAQAIDAQTLIGDSVDNVPGAAGIGPKTAAKLLARYGSARAVVEHADQLAPRQRDALRAFAPQLETTRRLVTLRDDVPIEFDLERAAVAGLRWDALRAAMEKLGFRRLPEQVPAPGPPTDPPPPHSSPAIEFPPAEARPASAVAPGGSRITRNAALEHPDGGAYWLVSTPEMFEAFARELSRQAEFAVDTETTSTNPIDADLVGLSFSWRVGEGYYVPVRSVFPGALDFDLVRARIGPLLADETRRKVGHNLKYDLIVLRQAGLQVGGPLFDTMIAAFVLDPLGSFRLDALAERLLGHAMIPITDLIGKGRDALRMDQVPLEHVAEYAAEDADYTWRLKELLEPQVRGSELSALFYETEMPLVAVLTEMEFNGIRVDVAYLKEMSAALAARCEAITAEVHALAGVKFNLDSPKQLGQVLFDRLGFRVVRTTRTARSTDAESLAALSQETGHPLLALLLEYREIQKLRGTYVDALPAAASPRTGRVHTSYHQTGAVTGRLSSSEPNLQNIPVRTELGRRIRRAFVPRTPAERLIVADYSQVELRVLAHFCRDETLIRAFAEDRDIHAFVAAQMNGVPLEAVTREMRSLAKAVNFGLIYGQTAFGLAQATGMSRGEAQQFIDEYFRRYPRIREFIDACVAAARRDGFVRTLLGRRRPIPDIDSRNRSARAQAERLAVNTVIQGSAADLIKAAMIALHGRIAGERLPLRMLLQVHDELVCEAPAERADEMMRIVAGVMTGAMDLCVPLRVDACVAENWLEAK